MNSMIKIILLTLSITSCAYELEVEIQPYECVSNWKYTLDGIAITDEIGLHITCDTINEDKL